MLLHVLFFTASLSLAPGAPVSPGAPATATPGPASARLQEPPPNTNPDKRPVVEELLGKLDKHMKKEGKEDSEGVAVIDLLLQEFKLSGPKDRVSIVKMLGKCFEQVRRVNEGEPPNNKLFLASAVALGQMGPESVEVLSAWIDHKNHRKDLALQSRLVASLGATKDVRAVKTLQNLLNHKENALIRAAGEALGEFAQAPQETRKSGFEALLKTLMEAKGQRDSDPGNTIFRDKYDVIGAALITSLGRLARHDERDPEKWQTWWNKNKKLDWDKDV